MRRRAGVFAAAALATVALAAPAGAKAQLTLTVKTVPALQGLDFELGGHRYTTSKSGVATIPAAPGTYRLVALPWRHSNRGIRVKFSRWGDDSFTPARTVTVDRSRTLEVGYGVSYLRGLSFYDCVGTEDTDRAMTSGCSNEETRPVSPSRVGIVVLANIIGEKYVLRSDQRVWLEGSRVARRLNGLEETVITYSVLHARVGGSDVVNQAQQRFYLARTARIPRGHVRLADKTFRIRLSLYDARFSTHDLLFRGPVGKYLQLIYPDGREQNKRLVDGKATLLSLPRGLYKVTVKTGSGLEMQVPVSLSKNQDMQLKVISYADIAGSFLMFALVSVGLVTARRPVLRAAIRRKLAKLGRGLRLSEAGR